MSAHWFRPRFLIAIAIAVSASAPALAQVSEADYSKLSDRVHPGDTVFVTTHTEGEIRGRLVRLSREMIIVSAEQGERTIAFSDVGWIEKRGDPLWNGALIGGAIWGFGMMAGAGASCSPDCATVVPAGLVIGVAEGLAGGALIDWLIPGRSLVYGKRVKERRDRPNVTAPAGSPQSRPSLASLWGQVAPGDRITIHTTRGGAIDGRFARASESSLGVADGNGLREIPASEVTEIRRYRGGTHVKKGLFVGVALGALSGTSPCYRVEEPYPPRSGSGMSCGAGVLLGAAAGGGAGALIGRMTWGSAVVYRVAPVASPHSVGVTARFLF